MILFCIHGCSAQKSLDGSELILHKNPTNTAIRICKHKFSRMFTYSLLSLYGLGRDKESERISWFMAVGILTSTVDAFSLKQLSESFKDEMKTFLHLTLWHRSVL